MKMTNKMHHIDKSIIPSQLYMFRAMFSPVIRSTWLYLQYVVMFTLGLQVGGWAQGQQPRPGKKTQNAKSAQLWKAGRENNRRPKRVLR